MNRRRDIVCALAAIGLIASVSGAGAQAARGVARTPAKGATAPAPPANLPTSPGAGPVIVFETVKGTFEIETYPNEAPKTVAHILDLVKRRFYNGLRVNRYDEGFVVQFGDPQTRDMSMELYWGTGGSGQPIGVAEFSRKRLHKAGSVAVAHAGDARGADSQMYITFVPRPELDRKYTVFGQVTKGMDVVRQLRKYDIIKRAIVKEPVSASAPQP